MHFLLLIYTKFEPLPELLLTSGQISQKSRTCFWYPDKCTQNQPNGIWTNPTLSTTGFYRDNPGSSDDPLILNCNNQGVIALTKDNKFHTCTKHIDMHYHFICEAVEDGKVAVQYILTGDNISDIFTKPLTKAKFWELAELLRLCVITCKV